jgi:hypothetical protein
MWGKEIKMATHSVTLVQPSDYASIRLVDRPMLFVTPSGGVRDGLLNARLGVTDEWTIAYGSTRLATGEAGVQQRIAELLDLADLDLATVPVERLGC